MHWHKFQYRAHLLTKRLFLQVYTGPKQWTSAFTRSAYSRPDKPKELVILYSGDAAQAGQFRHGNDANSSRNYIRTQRHDIRTAQSSTSQSAKSVYQSMVASSGPVQPSSSTAAPRNTEQIRNAIKSKRNAGRLSHDALFNLTEFSHDTDFIRRIVLYPDLEVIMIHPSAMDVFKSLLQPANASTGQ